MIYNINHYSNSGMWFIWMYYIVYVWDGLYAKMKRRHEKYNNENTTLFYSYSDLLQYFVFIME